MRLLHTSDWHLGRLFHGTHLTEDQSTVLRQLIDIAKEFNPDAIIVAGDIYDRSIPPPEAINLLDECLSELFIDLKAPVFMIAGNHDGPDRLGFASKLLEKQGLFIDCYPSYPLKRIGFQDKFGEIEVVPIPFSKAEYVRSIIKNEEIRTHQQAMHSLLGSVNFKSSTRKIAIAHAFISGGNESESEIPLSIGGSEMISHEIFHDFSYVALGHLHKRQSFNDNKIHYPGSLMKYSFSEEKHEKGITLVEMDSKGDVATEFVPLTPAKDLRCLKGELSKILQNGTNDKNNNDYIMITLTDKQVIYDTIGKLRNVYPNVMHIERENNSSDLQEISLDKDVRKASKSDLFAGFYREITGEEINEDQRTVFDNAVDDLLTEEREA